MRIIGSADPDGVPSIERYPGVRRGNPDVGRWRGNPGDNGCVRETRGYPPSMELGGDHHFDPDRDRGPDRPSALLEVVRTRCEVPGDAGALRLFAAFGVPFTDVGHPAQVRLAVARNLALERATASWVAFCDHRSRPDAGWLTALRADLSRVHDDPSVCASAGRTTRTGLADVAYRRSALMAVGGFDESEDAERDEDFDLQLLLVASGMRVDAGERTLAVVAGRGPSW
jgi:hypothetical protein